MGMLVVTGGGILVGLGLAINSVPINFHNVAMFVGGVVLIMVGMVMSVGDKNAL